MLREPVKHPRLYPTYVVLAAMDVLLTWVILSSGGIEVNAIARWVIEQHGPEGMVSLKFATVFFVLIVCEFVSRRSHGAGRRLAGCAVAISGVPVLAAACQLGWLAVAYAR